MIGTVCILLATLTYQAYLTVVPVLILYEVSCGALRGKPPMFQPIAKKLALLALVVLFAIGYMILSRHLLGYYTERGGFGTASSLGVWLTTKVHAVSDITVNTFVPVVAYYTGIEPALRAGKFVPFGLAGLTGALALWRGLGWMRAGTLTLMPLAMLLVPAAPFLLIDEQPESWRLAIPGMLGLMLSIGLILELLAGGRSLAEGRLRATGIAVLGGVLVGTLYPVAAYEAKLRVLGEELDREQIEAIRQHWRGAGVSSAEFGVVVFPDRLSGQDAAFASLKTLTRAYRKVGPMTSLGAHWAWRGFVAEQGLRPIPADSAPGFGELHARCLAEAGPGQRYSGWRVFHVRDHIRRVSAICRR